MAETVLVSGGAGFIGSHLCDRLVEEGKAVICVDNLCTGSKKNIAHLLKNKRFSFIKRDITKPLGIKQKLLHIYNLASPASPADYLRLPVETLLTSSLGTRNLLELALKNKARFLQASTSEVYGDPLEHPQKESYWGNVNPVGERSCYDESKRFAEALVVAYNRKLGLETRIARLFNTFGPRMLPDDGRVVPNFINQAMHGKDITVYGDGSQTRSFCFVSDMVEGLIKLMESNYSLPVNLGNPEEYTILEFAKKINGMLGNKSEIVFKPLPSDDPRQRKPDISLAKKLLGWQPGVSVDDGLMQTIGFFKKAV